MPGGRRRWLRIGERIARGCSRGVLADGHSFPGEGIGVAESVACSIGDSPHADREEYGKCSCQHPPEWIFQDSDRCPQGAAEGKQQPAEEPRVIFDIVPAQMNCSARHHSNIGFQLAPLKCEPVPTPLLESMLQGRRSQSPGPTRGDHPPRRPVGNACHVSRRPVITIRSVLGLAIPPEECRNLVLATGAPDRRSTQRYYRPPS